MIDVRFKSGDLTPSEQQAITAGFARHTEELSAPNYEKERVNWLAFDADGTLVAGLTADLLWDWLYIDELWVSEGLRGGGLGKKLMKAAESYASSRDLTGLWLWTQSWQAADFYQHLGFVEFTQFPDFPKGHLRIGFRKQLVPDSS